MGVEAAILIGSICNLLVLLMIWARPKVQTEIRKVMKIIVKNVKKIKCYNNIRLNIRFLFLYRFIWRNSQKMYLK